MGNTDGVYDDGKKWPLDESPLGRMCEEDALGGEALSPGQAPSAQEEGVPSPS